MLKWQLGQLAALRNSQWAGQAFLWAAQYNGTRDQLPPTEPSLWAYLCPCPLLTRLTLLYCEQWVRDEEGRLLYCLQDPTVEVGRFIETALHALGERPGRPPQSPG
jgi:hypothetical protein